LLICTLSGADALTVGIGSVVECRVDVCEGEALCVGRELLVGRGVVLAETLTLGEGVPPATCSDDDEFVTIGKMISAPTMKNTAAIATLDSGIASSGG
jgi:hypothetical protein